MTRELATRPDIPGCSLSKTGLKLKKGLAYNDWVRVGEWLFTLEQSLQWYIGDWLAYGEFAYGEKYADPHLLDRFAAGTLRQMCWVANNVNEVTRNPNLSYSHHRVVAPLPVREQRLWLSRAEQEGWSYPEFRKQVDASTKAPMSKRVDQPCWLYRFYNGVGELLYVGITDSPTRRFPQHADRKPWFVDVTRIEIVRHSSRHQAVAQESKLINLNHPRYNMVHNVPDAKRLTTRQRREA